MQSVSFAHPMLDLPSLRSSSPLWMGAEPTEHSPVCADEMQKGRTSRGKLTPITADRLILITGEIADQTAADFAVQLAEMNAGGSIRPITVQVSSEGGDLLAALAILEGMRESHSPVHTVCIGYAFSAGALIVMHGKEGQRRMGRRSWMMLHEPRCASPSSRHTDFQDRARWYTHITRQVAELVAERSHLTERQARNTLRRDTYHDAVHAQELGFIDHII